MDVPQEFTPQEWCICQTYAYAMMRDDGRDVSRAMESLWPDVITRFVKYMGWKK